MSISTACVKYIESKLMLGVDSRGESVLLSSSVEREPVWRGVKPNELLLISAASCSLYDVIEILTKQREEFLNLEVECRGTQLADPPYRFTHIHLTYKVWGRVHPDKLEKAIRLSQDKYCSVIATLRPAVEITSDFEIIA